MSTDLAVRPVEIEPMASGPMTLWRSEEPDEIIAKATKAATALAEVVKKQKLTTNIQGRNHVRVEGWTLLGSMTGVFPVLVWSRPVEEGGWEARVEARTLAGQVVGAAESMCLRSEEQWSWEPKDRYGKPLKARDDFALRSMAQTRATSKALRQPLGFVMTLAGFDATPAEEMPRDEPPSESSFQAPKAPPPAKAAAPQQGSSVTSAFTFPSGKYQGKTLDEAPGSYLSWYADNGPREDVKDAIRARLGIVADPMLGDEDIPFAPTSGHGY